MAKKVYSKEERHDQAVKIGIKFAKQVGLGRLSLGSVASELQVTAPLLFHVFGNRDNFRKAVAKAAKAAGVTFPEAQPTVRAARAARFKKAKPVPKLKPPKVKAKAKPVVVAPKAKAAPKKAKPVPKLKPPKAKAKPVPAVKRVRAPKGMPVELTKFPAPVAPSVSAPP